MDSRFLWASCPPELEDEAYMIEHGGEMPEVDLADSLAHAGELSPEGLACLRASCARAYLRIILRDLDPAQVGTGDFRGLDRARANLARLERFLEGVGWRLPDQARHALAGAFCDYLGAEQRALAGGRPYASAPAEEARGLAVDLGLDPAPWDGLLSAMAALPAPDFLGLRALARLEGPAARKAAAKRRVWRDGRVVLALVDGQGKAVAMAALPWIGPADTPDEENTARAELVWSLLSPPEAEAGA